MGDLERTARFLVKCFLGFSVFYFIVNFFSTVID